MPDMRLPLIIEADQLEPLLDDPNLVIVDMTKADTYNQYHIPGALFLEYPRIIHIEKPVMGMLPDEAQFNQVINSLGIKPDSHVIAYDDEGGGKACRFLWTLEVFGHPHYSLLNGGLHAWANESHSLQAEISTATPSDYRLARTENATTNYQYILERLDDDSMALLDTRTTEEYTGVKNFAARAGHIPGAVNMDWLLTMDKDRNLRLLADETLKNMLLERGISKDKEVIVYCQSHHRSAHTYIMLKHLGYQNVKGYPGAWSEWANLSDTPVEI